MHLLITGATGTLGRHATTAAQAAGYDVRLQSRRPHPEGQAARWAVADLETGEGLAHAVGGVEVVLHLASDPRRPQAVDVEGTRRLVRAAEAAGVQHLVYVSIVGVDRIPLGYYRAKREAEEVVAACGVPHSILRATQFHAFLDALIGGAARVPLVLPLPTDFQVQPVAAEEVAARLVQAVGEGPMGRLPDFGGPEVLTVGEAVAAWKRARGVTKPVVPMPIPGAVAAGFRAGHNTAADGERGALRWAEWLRR